MERYQFKNLDAKRSRNMRAIKSKNTAIEIILRKALFKKGLRYRIHYNKLPGKPDIVFVQKKVVVFCDSEFWHGKNWASKKKKIKNNRAYWIPKIERNKKRDKDNNVQLKKLGWIVMRFWEADIKKNTGAVVESIMLQLSS